MAAKVTIVVVEASGDNACVLEALKAAVAVLEPANPMSAEDPRNSENEAVTPRHATLEKAQKTTL